MCDIALRHFRAAFSLTPSVDPGCQALIAAQKVSDVAPHEVDATEEERSAAMRRALEYLHLAMNSPDDGNEGAASPIEDRIEADDIVLRGWMRRKLPPDGPCSKWRRLRD